MKPQGELALEEVCPFDIIDRAVGRFADAARAKGLALHGAWTGPTVKYVGDPSRLGQMISNLVDNALELTLTGEVTVEGRELARDGDMALIEVVVTDTGIGLSPSHLAALLLELSRIESPTRRDEGSGLGLSIVQNLAARMGGDVDVRSVEGQGSSFSFRVCLTVLPETTGACAESAEVERGAPAPRPRILVAEDNATNRLVIHRLLTRAGYDVDVAHDGREAITRLADHPRPELVLMDCQMPEMDGLEATRHIRASEARGHHAHVPIIALTANAFDEERVHCLAAGMDDFLTKPIDVPALHAALARWLRR